MHCTRPNGAQMSCYKQASATAPLARQRGTMRTHRRRNSRKALRHSHISTPGGGAVHTRGGAVSECPRAGHARNRKGSQRAHGCVAFEHDAGPSMGMSSMCARCAHRKVAASMVSGAPRAPADGRAGQQPAGGRAHAIGRSAVRHQSGTLLPTRSKQIRQKGIPVRSERAQPCAFEARAPAHTSQQPHRSAQKPRHLRTRVSSSSWWSVRWLRLCTSSVDPLVGAAQACEHRRCASRAAWRPRGVQMPNYKLHYVHLLSLIHPPPVPRTAQSFSGPPPNA